MRRPGSALPLASPTWLPRVGNIPLRRITPGQSRPLLPAWASCRHVAWASGISDRFFSRISCDVLTPSPVCVHPTSFSLWFWAPRCDGAQARNGAAVSLPSSSKLLFPFDSHRAGETRSSKQDRARKGVQQQQWWCQCLGCGQLKVGLEVRLEAGHVCFGQSSMHSTTIQAPTEPPHELSALPR